MISRGSSDSVSVTQVYVLAIVLFPHKYFIILDGTSESDSAAQAFCNIY